MDKGRVGVFLVVFAGLLGFDFVDGRIDAGDVVIDLLSLLGIVIIVALFARFRALTRGEKITLQNEKDGLWAGLRRIWAAIVGFFFPTYGTCYRCHMPWAVTRPVLTAVENFLGQRNTSVFALCKPCFDELEPYQRLTFYGQMYGELVGRALAEGLDPREYEVLASGEIVNLDWEHIRTVVQSGPPAHPTQSQTRCIEESYGYKGNHRSHRS